MNIGGFELSEPLPVLQEPHAMAIVRPWVNVGRVGTLVLARLERHLAGRQLGKLSRPGDYFDFTRYRPRTRISTDRRQLILPNSTIGYTQREHGPDFLLLNLREPHSYSESYVESVVDILKTFNVKRYCLLGGMYDVVPHTRPLLVSGSTSGPKLADQAKQMRVRETTYQGPTSITTLITQEARKLGIEHMSFVVHLPQYVQLDEDYTGAARLMELLCTIYDLPRELADWNRGQSQYAELTAAVDRNPEVKSVLEQLERQYDQRERDQERPEEPAPPPLSSEVERFLRELDQEPEPEPE